ncbi:MAG: UV radiation resistance protein/autophagy-related protein 14 [Piptocephalis tieghemiana]|nr:MAG: UV radiation resistance protein/autophagy-related protein 14 [Piptocephalis tieghemiana]
MPSKPTSTVWTLDKVTPDKALSKTVKTSMDKDQLYRLSQLTDQVLVMQEQVDQWSKRVEGITAPTSASVVIQSVKISQQKERLRALRERFSRCTMQIELGQRRVDELMEKTRLRRVYMNHGNELVKEKREHLYHMTREVERKRQDTQALQRCIRQHRLQLTSRLADIYPIERAPTIQTIYTIRGQCLPNSQYSGHDQERIGTALGFTAHLIRLMSLFLDVPLRYPLYPRSSQSVVEDPLIPEDATTERYFPLSLKGQDKGRFDYAVLLLNKDVELLLRSQGMAVVDIRKTLPNLLRCVEALAREARANQRSPVP